MSHFDNSSSPIPTRRAKSDMSEINFSVDSVFSNFRFSKRVVFNHWLLCQVVMVKLFSKAFKVFLIMSGNVKCQHFADPHKHILNISIFFLVHLFY